jgi:hypothetical protein
MRTGLGIQGPGASNWSTNLLVTLVGAVLTTLLRVYVVNITSGT